jgi:hypothetical protein
VQLPKKMSMSRWTWQAAETIISAGVSHVTGPAELNEMVQYSAGDSLHLMGYAFSYQVSPNATQDIQDRLCSMDREGDYGHCRLSPCSLSED